MPVRDSLTGILCLKYKIKCYLIAAISLPLLTLTRAGHQALWKLAENALVLEFFTFIRLLAVSYNDTKSCC